MSRSTLPLRPSRCVLAFCALLIVQLAVPWRVAADAFSWRGVGGSNFVTGVRNQNPAGTCWAFAATAALEAKYLLTRNDPTYALNLSEQNLVCPGTMGGITGGQSYLAMNYFANTGIVREGELPYTAQNTSPLWPLQYGWESRVVKSVPDQSGSGYLQVLDDPASVKAALKAYGPLVVYVNADDDLNQESVGTSAINHAVLLVSYHDDSSYAGGGYFYIKNSWGTGWFENGYDWVTYANLERHPQNVYAITGQAYYTGSMGTLTWVGTSGDSWTTTQERLGLDVALQSWPNGEYSAVFNSPTNPAVPVSVGNVSVHRLDIDRGAVGYRFTGGRLLVTGGGIHTQEDCTIDSTVALGMNQTWTVVAGKALTVNGNVKMHINSLTIGGDGQTTLNGNVEDVSSDPQFTGLLTGYHPSLTKIGAGVLILTGNNTYTGGTTVNGGVLRFGSASAIPASGAIDVQFGGTAATSPALLPAFLAKVKTSSDGTVALTADSTGNVDMTPFPLLGMGAVGTVAFTHNVTPNGTTYRLGGGGGTLVYSSAITGANSLIVRDGGSGGVVVLTGANTYTGGTTVSGGMLRFDSASAIPASGAIDVQFGGTAATSPALLPALLAKVATASAGTVALTFDSTGNVDMSPFPLLGLGAVGTVAFTHSVAPNGTTYRLGGGGGTLIFSSAITGANNLVVRDGGSGGAVVLTGANTYTGATTIAGGTLQCGDGTSGHDGASPTAASPTTRNSSTTSSACRPAAEPSAARAA